MSYRDDFDALNHRVDALEREAAAAVEKAAEARRELADAVERRRLPVLDNIQVAAPCKADWAQMSGDEQVRFCGQCEKNVYNLSSMTRAEAEALLIAKEGKLCVRYYQRADGTILTADCPEGLKRRRRRRRIVAATFGAMSTLAAGASLLHRAPIATMGAPRPVQIVPVEVKGEVVPVMGDVLVPTPVMGEPAPQPLMGSVKPLMGKPAFVPPTKATKKTR